MKFDYTIKNFRAFDSKGATFTISPITILTGTNSSGKSSMVKSLRLLNTFIRGLKEDASRGMCYPGRRPLDFSNSELQLGSLNSNCNYASKLKVANLQANNEPVPEDLSCITFSYTVFSTLISQLCTVELKFRSSDSLKEEQDDGVERYGWLASLSIVSEDKGFELLVEFENGRPLIKKFNRTTTRDFFYVHMEAVANALTPQFNGSEANDTIIQKTRAYVGLKWKYFSNIEPEMIGNASASDSLLLIPDDEYLWTDASAFWESISKKQGSSYFAKIAEKIQADYRDSGAATLHEYIQQKEKAWFKELSIDRKQSQFDDEEPREFFKATRKIVRLKDELEYYSLEHLAKNCKEISFPILVRFFKELSGYSSIGTLYDRFQDFCNDVIKETLFSDSLVNLTYIGSSRASVKRLYTLNDASEPFDRLLAKYFQLSKLQPKGSGFQPGTFISRWIDVDREDSFRLGKKLNFDEIANGMAIVPSLFKSLNEGVIELADLGYGVTQLLSILISIEVDIMEKMQINHSEKLPVSYIAIEEPEIHLHPRLQSLLADMFLEAYLKYNVRFIIETHSEYLIRKYQYLVAGHSNNAEFGVDASEICIYYLYDADPTKRPEGQQQVQRIELEEDGVLSNPFGKGFFDEADELAMGLWDMKFGCHE